MRLPGRAASIVAGLAALAIVVAALVIHGVTDGWAPQQAGGIATQSPATTQTSPKMPPRLADLRHGTPPALPYWWAGALYLGSKRIPMPEPRELVGNNGAVLVLPVQPSGAVDLVSGTRLVRLTAHGAYASVSPDGDLATWELPGGSFVSIALWDLSARTQLAHLTTTIRHSACCGGGDSSYPDGVDDAGRVYLGDGDDFQIWDHRSALYTELTGVAPRDGYDGIRGTGPVIAKSSHSIAADAPMHAIYGEVDADGTFRPMGRYGGQGGVWSVDATRVLYVDGTGHVFVRDVSSGKTVTIDVPTDVDLDSGAAVWESPTSVLLAGEQEVPGVLGINRPGAVLRCDAASGGCVLAAFTAHVGAGIALPRPSWRF